MPGMKDRFRILAVVVAACVTLSFGVSTGAAHTTSFPTALEQGGSSEGNEPDLFIFRMNGGLTSPQQKCRSSRTVKLFFVDDGVTTLKDIDDRSSQNGFWAMGGKATAKPDSILIKVIKQRLGSSSGHKHVCAGDELVYIPA